MTHLQAILLGLIQGFAEPIPVSSSAQTRLFALAMEIQTPGIVFEVFLNFASFLAILYLTRQDVIRLVKGFFSYLFSGRKASDLEPFRTSLFIVLGTLPVLFTGFTMQEVIDTQLSGPKVIASFLVLTGLLLFLVRKLDGKRTFDQMTWKDALLIGLVQGTLAVIPGVSRSGATIVAALALGLGRDTAFRFSFLLYLPIGLGTMILGAKDLFGSADFAQAPTAYGLAFLVAVPATVVGYKLFRSVVEKGQLAVFTAYCWAVATLVFVVL